MHGGHADVELLHQLIRRFRQGFKQRFLIKRLCVGTEQSLGDLLNILEGNLLTDIWGLRGHLKLLALELALNLLRGSHEGHDTPEEGVKEEFKFQLRYLSVLGEPKDEKNVGYVLFELALDREQDSRD